MSEPVLSLRDLRVTFRTPNGVVQAVRGVDLDVAAGEVVGVVGECGSGKSVTFLALMGLLPRSAADHRLGEGRRRRAGRCRSRKAMNGVRGKQVAMIFQDPLSALNPVHRIGDQIVEMIRRASEDVDEGRPRARPSSCSTSSASRSPTSGPGSTRTSSRAACASV